MNLKATFLSAALLILARAPAAEDMVILDGKLVPRSSLTHPEGAPTTPASPAAGNSAAVCVT